MQLTVVEKKTVDEWLNAVDYSDDPDYTPSQFALEFVSFIKLVDGGNSENKTPVVHYKMLDNFVADHGLDIINLCHRGMAKSTLKEYLILYLAVFNVLPGLGEVPYALYVSDSMDNGVKKMRKQLEMRWETSEFLRELVPEIRFTDIRWEFTNASGKKLVVTGHGAKTGVRGTRENGSRPVLALLDDLISDADANSPTIIRSIEDTVNKAIEHAMHPTRRRIIWSGTPFNQNDPVYKAVESGGWAVNVFPVAEKFPCTKEEFKGSWEDRFTYESVLAKYNKALAMGEIHSFNQELMLRIMSEEDRLIQDNDIVWYSRDKVLEYRSNFNFYITTDFATSDKSSSDYSIISVWAYNANGDWLWVDGICKKQLMDANVNDLFRLAQMYNPQSVGIEVTGQQGGFIPWIQEQMIIRNVYFNIASENNNGKPGFRPSTKKIERFHVVVPLFKVGKIKFPKELKDTPAMQEAMNELSLVSVKGFKSKHDDFIDTISMLSIMKAWKPSSSGSFDLHKNQDGIWELDDSDDNFSGYINSYIV